MRTFELADGGSAKFWHIGRDGTAVTVRFGRIGTNGQTRVKELATEEAAIAHVDRLVAEKITKGYAEGRPAAGAARTRTPAAAATGNATPAAETVAHDARQAADEDEFVVPNGWLRVHHARRGGRGIGNHAVSPASRQAATALLDNNRDWLVECLGAAGTPEDIAAAGTAWIADPSTGTPVGAAAVAVLLIQRLGWHNRDRTGRVVDLLLSHHDAAFAAQAMVVTISLELVPTHYGVGGEKRAIRWTSTVPQHGHWMEAGTNLLRGRVRAALAATSEEQYTAAVGALAAYRRAGQRQRVMTSFLAPTRRDWVDADSAELAAHPDSGLARLLLCSVTTPEQAAQVFPHAGDWELMWQAPLLYTFAEGLGSAAAPWVDSLLGNSYAGTDERRRIFGILGAIPTDEAFRLTLARVDEKQARPALVEAAGRFPRRALRLLAEAGGQRVAGDLLRAHVMAHPDLVAEMLPGLPSGAAARVRALVASQVEVAEAAEADLPPLLVSPPWTVKRAARRPVVVDGLVCDDPPGIEWAPGEHEEWAGVHTWMGDPHRIRNADWEALAAQVKAGQGRWSTDLAFFLNGPDEHTRPLLATWRTSDFWDSAAWGRRMVAKYELDALPAMLDAARRNASGISVAMMPYTGTEVAALMADWFARLKVARAVALAWLTRHPRSAARALVPAALGRVAGARRSAGLALRAIAGAGHADTVLLVAKEYSDVALDGIEQLLSTDPVDLVPDRMPKVPEWASAALLPRIQLRGGRGAVPVAAAQHVVSMLAISRRGEPYAGIPVVQEACEPHALSEFAWGLFQAWQSAGAPSKEGWAFDALGVLGDDEVVRRLAPVIRAWPGEGGHARAVTGLDILAGIGSDVALMHLNGIAQKVKFRGLKDKANEKVAEVADALGLTPEQLADRLVPDFGLDPGGSLTLDFGPRQFVVGFDEQLKPIVTDETGKRRKDLPKPAAKDDPELAPEAQRRFAALKKDVRTVAADQVRRLEQAMVTQRRWSGADFTRFFVAHPLLWHVVRRLVWGRYDDAGALVGALRVAEDRTFADVNDDPVELDDEATVGVAHPLHLADTLPTWSELFADYEILQPFPQLGRETFTLRAEDAKADELTRYVDVELPTTKVLGLERRGWRRGEAMDGGVQGWMERDLPGGGCLVLGLDPGIAVGAIDMFEEQKLAGISVSSRGGYRWDREHRLHLRDLDPVTVSELIRDLEELTA